MTIIVQFVSVLLVGLFTNDGAVAVSGAGYLRSYASVHFKDTLFPMGCAAPAGSLVSVVICVASLSGWSTTRISIKIYQVGDESHLYRW